MSLPILLLLGRNNAPVPAALTTLETYGRLLYPVPPESNAIVPTGPVALVDVV